MSEVGGLFVALLFLIMIFLGSKSGKSEFSPKDYSKTKKRQYGHPCITKKGEKVKSHAEKTIADYFFENNILYEYERKIPRIGKPDFYLTEYDVVVEYWGLINHPDIKVKSKYEKSMRWKMAQYHSRGIKLISIYPRNLKILDKKIRGSLSRVNSHSV